MRNVRRGGRPRRPRRPPLASFDLGQRPRGQSDTKRLRESHKIPHYVTQDRDIVALHICRCMTGVTIAAAAGVHIFYCMPAPPARVGNLLSVNRYKKPVKQFYRFTSKKKFPGTKFDQFGQYEAKYCVRLLLLPCIAFISCN